MSLEIWTGVAWAKGGYGGWSHARLDGGAPSVAGGDRRTTEARMALTAVIEALREIAGDPARPVRLLTPHRKLIAAPTEPDEDADLRETLAKLIAARTAPVAFADSPCTDVAAVFAHGWAEFALNIAKTKGAFNATIPASNLKTMIAKRGLK
jgi:hypothetical protein